MLKHYDRIYIAAHWVGMLEYGDSSALTDVEYEQFNGWLNRTIPPRSSFQYGEDSEFCRDDVSGLLAECVQVDVYAQQVDIDNFNNMIGD